MTIPDSRSLGNILDTVLEQVRQSFDLPGIAVGVVQGADIVYARGFGVRDIRTQEPVTVRSLFHQASISKLFTAAAVMQLRERGQVCLDDPIVKHLPAFRLADERSESITIEHLLTHTSGMPDPEDHDWAHPEYDEGALQRMVSTLHSLPLITGPGQEFAYSSLGYNVLGALVAQVSGGRFEAYVKHNLLEPLGMHDSTFFKPGVPLELATSPHIRTPEMMVSGIFPYSRSQAPSSTLQSSALDMCRWASAHLIGSSRGNRPTSSPAILSSRNCRLLWQPRARTGQDQDSRQTKVGLGWFVGKYRGVPVAMHDGGDVGYEAELTLLPEQKIAVAVMANVFPARTAAITRAVLDVVLGVKVRVPKPPRLVAVLAALREAGWEAAVAQYGQPDQAIRAADRAFLRDSLFILREAAQPEQASELSRLDARLFPDLMVVHKAED